MFLQKLGICHRDLKPENILLSQNQIKIIDFGLSDTYDKLLIEACGSPCYTAPEMLSGSFYDGSMVDLWSLGVILYAMLTLKLPF